MLLKKPILKSDKEKAKTLLEEKKHKIIDQYTTTIK